MIEENTQNPFGFTCKDVRLKSNLTKSDQKVLGLVL